jgi:hypothetical protein
MAKSQFDTTLVDYVKPVWNGVKCNGTLQKINAKLKNKYLLKIVMFLININLIHKTF